MATLSNGGAWCWAAQRALAALATTLAIVLSLGSACALAAQTRKLVNTFGGASSAVPDAAPLSGPQGIDIHQAGDEVYVADTANHRIEKFDAEGNLLLAFGADVGGIGIDTCTLSCGPGTAGSEPGQFTTAQFIAVDNSGGESSGDVYVGDVGDNLISKFNAAGELIESWGSEGQLNGSTTPAKSFGAIAGIAVDSAGALYVLNTASELFKFAQDGAFVEEFSGAGEGGSEPRGLAVDAAGDFFKVNEGLSIEKLTATGSTVGRVSVGKFVDPARGSIALAIDPASDDLYVATVGETIDHYAFNGAGEVIEPGGSTCEVSGSGCAPSDSVATAFTAAGIAVNSESGDVYLVDPSAGQVDVYATVTIPDVITEAASELGPTSATLNGSVNPDGIQLTECHFDYGTSTAYGQSAPCVPAAASIPPDSSFHAVSAKVSGLQPGQTYHFRLVAANGNGTSTGADESFNTPPPPSIDSATVSELSSVSARLNAKINPRGFDTHYRFEWGATTEYENRVPVPDEDIGAGEGDVAVSQVIEGLEAGITYHWRVVATNANGTTTSPDHTFIYQLPGAALPDNRAYEMVTPPQKNGALIGDVFTEQRPEVAASSSRVIASTIQCFGDAQSCSAERGAIGSPYAFTRTSAGWLATALAPPSTQFPAATKWGSNVDEGTVLFSAPTEPFGEDDFYARLGDGTFSHIGPATPPQHGPQGPKGGHPSSLEQALSADLSHVVWVTREHWPFDEGEGFTPYEYVGVENPQPLLVGVSGGQGSTALISRCGTALGSPNDPEPLGKLSRDGRTIYFTAFPCETGTGTNEGKKVPAFTLYARVDNELSDAHTVLISAHSPADCTGECQSSPPADAQFIGASADGSKVLFASTQRLTDDAGEDGDGADTATENACRVTTGANGCNLYMYDFANPAGHELIDVSAGDSSVSGPRFQGPVAISPEGSHVYFIAKGVLTATPNTQGQRAGDGANNLYLFERDASHPGGRVAFIASLPSSDSEEWTLDAGIPASVTPDGRYLAFVSRGKLTRDDTSASGAQQVFRYDAQTGALIRISVGDEGFNDNGNRSTPTPCGPNACSEDASIPAPTPAHRFNLTMSNDGAYVFFQSPVGLTAHALDDVQVGVDGESGNPTYAQNVYEWHGGHVYLISDGRDVSLNAGAGAACSRGNIILSSVCLLGTDVSGANVFFSTVDQLSTQDTDTELDYYDARICTEADPCIKPPPAAIECQGDACQGSPTPQPPLATVASISFAGASPAGPPPAGKVKVLAHAVHGARFVLTVKVPGEGRIAISGAGVATLRRAVARAGTYRFTVSLTAKARASMHRHHRHRLRLRLRVGFSPSSGTPSSASVSVTVRI